MKKSETRNSDTCIRKKINMGIKVALLPSRGKSNKQPGWKKTCGSYIGSLDNQTTYGHFNNEAFMKSMRNEFCHKA